MSDQDPAFTNAVLTARTHVRSWGASPIVAAKDLQQQWLRVELDAGAVDPRGASDAFVDAVRIALGREENEVTPTEAPAVRRILAERVQAKREEASHARI